MKRLLLFLLPLLFTVSLLAQRTAGEWADEALAAAARSDEPAARAAYDSLLARGYASPAIYLNLGNSHLRAGNKGEAVLAYERGLKLAPGNGDLRESLRFAVSQLDENIREVPGFFLLRWWRNLGALLGPGGAAILSLLFIWGGAYAFFLWWKRRAGRPRLRWGVLVAALSLIFGVLFFFLGTSRQAWLNDHSRAVLIAPRAEIRVAPNVSSTQEGSLSEGLRMTVIDEFGDGEWLKIRLDNGRQGWVRGDLVERI